MPPLTNAATDDLWYNRAMFQVTRIIHFCYGHRLMNYEGKCKHLHGHNGRVEVELTSAHLDNRGMVMDFSDIKRQLQTWIDAELDHKMLLRKDDPAVSVLEQLGEPLHLFDENPTAENIAKHICDQAQRMHFPVTSVRLWETENACATFLPATATAD
jgi:6-pyruvoyltetrahydropterin/6-carboxytetrahydropterin synthase